MPSAARPPRILFVCTGNICRSPTAHALLVHQARAAGLPVEVDSAAISDEERGNPFDRRAAAELRRRGVPAHEHRARQVRRDDFARFDWIVGMTAAHCAALRRLAPAGSQAQVALLLDFVPGAEGRDVPDPWYGSAQDFVHAFDLIARGVDGLMEQLRPPIP
ncbi:low molecular weight protein-tyrosine-phosphatase [Pseudorhodoferax sp.]|uniref:low molecular weight protein-tyrosine-phosphatase n=1 Tax=Pseudorhodoferax sp. TaxID=1993553 RepID=UPI0039E6F09B